MKKYLVMEVQTNADETVGNIVFAYDDRETAYNKFFSICAAAAVSSIPTHTAVMLTNEGTLVETRCFKHSQPEPEPDPELETTE